MPAAVEKPDSGPESAPAPGSGPAGEASLPSGDPPAAGGDAATSPSPTAPHGVTQAPADVLPPWAQELRDLVTRPVAGADPAGESLVREPEYEALEEEIKGPQQLTPKPVDWSEVRSGARALLDTKTKDVKLAAYLAVAEVEVGRVRGHACAAVIFADLASTFGDALWPRRVRGRNNALEWAAERLLESAKGIPESTPDVDVLELAARMSGKALTALRDAFEEPGNELSSMRVFAKWTAQIEQAATKAKRAREKPAEAAPAAPTTGGGGGGISIESAEDAKKAAPKIRDLLKRSARVLRASSPSDPEVYRASRFATWPTRLPFEVAPDGQTPVPFPDASGMEARLANAEASATVETVGALESLFLERPWWLDVQRVQAQTLGSLGEPFAGAAAAVTAELLSLVTRLPVVLECRFATGAPFADASTLAWLETLTASSGSGPVADEDDPVVSIESEARAAVARKDVRAAVGAYQKGLDAHASPRLQFLLRLGLARTCSKAGHPSIALPHLEKLRSELGRCSLEEWDPSLAAQVLEASVVALRAAAKEKGAPAELRGRAEDALAELSRLDPLAALELRG
ncbi:MAG: type VI secretion system protein TssA [Planctomycetota bacterium]